MKRLLSFLSIIIIMAVSLKMAISFKALPDWPRKYATSVIRGHLINIPETDKATPFEMSVSGNASNTNIKGEMHPYSWAIDSTGTFYMKWETCWPLNPNFTIHEIGLNMPLCPGDTIDMEIDLTKAKELKEDVGQLYREAIKIRGATIPLSPQYRALLFKLLDGTNTIHTDYLQECCRAGFATYREKEWEKHQQRMKAVKASKLKKQEKEFMQLAMEEKYVYKLYLFNFLMGYSGCDSAEIAVAKQQFTDVDPHAASMMFPQNINGAYFFNTEYLEYLVHNGLDNLPLGCYLKARKQAEGVVTQVKAFRPVSPDSINALSPEFRQPIYELKAEIAEKRQNSIGWQPTGEPDSWLPQIVAHHNGHIVFIDFWATWCGPCQKGISEMATVKEKYEKRGIDFVYITDNSSSTDGYLNMKQKHKGDHFLFPKEDMGKMKIPEYTGSIPHYLIYNRDGQLIKAISGWIGLENMTKELDEALAK